MVCSFVCMSVGVMRLMYLVSGVSGCCFCECVCVCDLVGGVC